MAVMRIVILWKIDLAVGTRIEWKTKMRVEIVMTA
jgi:hypothetical protein